MKHHFVVLSAALLLSASAWADDVVRKGSQTVRVTDDGEVVITDSSGGGKKASKVRMSKSGKISVNEGADDAAVQEGDEVEVKSTQKAAKKKKARPQVIDIK